MTEFLVADLGGGVWEISEGDPRQGIKKHVDAYLVTGKEKAVLIDTLMNEGGLVDIVKGLTKLPLEVIITHGHPDHAGKEALNFARAGYTMYMHEAERDESLSGKSPVEKNSVLREDIFTPIENGKIFDLGGRKLEVILLPGHTYGSILLLDRENKLLFTGDAVGAGIIWMQTPSSTPLDVFLENLNKLDGILEEFDNIVIYPGHLNQARVPLDKKYLADLKELVRKIIAGEEKGREIDEEYTANLFPGALMASNGGMYRFCFMPGRIVSDNK